MKNEWIEDRPEERDVVYVQGPGHRHGAPPPGLHANLLVLLTLLRIAREVWGWLVRAFIAGFAFCLVIVAVFRLMTVR